MAQRGCLTMNTYQYQSMVLEQPCIRLLRLIKGSPTCDIHCELFETFVDHFEDGVRYDALSYTWGFQEKTARIMFGDSVMHITLNLYEILQQLRREDEDQILWIDAICINQNDSREKSTQLAQMASIYSSASRTIAYLGHASQYTIMAIDFISQLRFAPEDFRQLNYMLHDQAYKHRWVALGEILNSSYWTRIWIAQEIAVSSNVILQIGHHIIELDVFKDVVLKLVSNYINNIHHDIHIALPYLQLNAVWAILEARRRYHTKSKPNLGELLILFLSSNATKPADKVYGISSMCAETWQEQLPLPNYRLPLSMVYTAAVRAVIKTSGNLDILSALNSPFALPSWCPNFNGSSPACLQSMESSWRCAGNRKLVVTFVGAGTMRLKGFVLDEIDRIFLTDDLHDDNTSAWANNMKAYLMVMAWSPYGDEIHRREALQDTLTRESPTNAIGKARTALRRLSCDDSEDLEKESDIYSTWCIRRLLEDGSGPWSHGQSRRNHRNFANHRGIALTKQGLICLLPETATVGDKIVVLYGGRVPFCVRRAENEGDGEAWRFIGDCYVHGIMHGEAMEMVDATTELERYFDFI